MSLEANKIAAAILVGGMLTLSTGLIANMIYGGHEGGEEHAGGEGAAPAPAAKPAPVEPISGLLASADVAKGEKLAAKCTSCHTFGKGEANKVGPNQWGLVGDPTAHKEDFQGYSEALKNLHSTWTYENLNQFLANPKAHVPGTKMAFPGLPKTQDRADLIAWIRTQADTPAPLPTPDEIKKAEDEAKQAAAPAEGAPAEGAQPEAAAQPEGNAPAQAEGAGAPAAAPAGEDAVPLIAAADPKAGEKVAVKCKACHDFTKGGPNKVGPNLWGVVGGPSAHKEDFAGYSDAIKNLKITWDFENLQQYLTNPKKFAPGNKMAFPGLAKVQDRANLLRWLRDQSDSPIPLPQ